MEDKVNGLSELNAKRFFEAVATIMSGRGGATVTVKTIKKRSEAEATRKDEKTA